MIGILFSDSVPPSLSSLLRVDKPSAVVEAEAAAVLVAVASVVLHSAGIS